MVIFARSWEFSRFREEELNLLKGLILFVFVQGVNFVDFGQGVGKLLRFGKGVSVRGDLVHRG